MKISRCTELTSAQKEQLFRLWNQEYQARLALADLNSFDNYLQPLGNKKHLLLSDDQNNILGWCYAFDRDGLRWFAIILDGRIHGSGFGTRLLDKLKETETALCGWVTDHENDRKSNGANYISPLRFYLKNGFTVLKDQRLETDKLSAVKIVWQR